MTVNVALTAFASAKSVTMGRVNAHKRRDAAKARKNVAKAIKNVVEAIKIVVKARKIVKARKNAVKARMLAKGASAALLWVWAAPAGLVVLL
jgi:hypothetical protein